MNFKRMIPMMMIASAPLAGMAQGKAGIIESNLDRSANPAEDFYQFATGGWQKANPLPAAYSRFGSFDQLQENNNKRINGILSELLKKNYSKGTVEQKLSDFYKLAMDSVRRNREGVAPVKPILDRWRRPAPSPTCRKCRASMASSATASPWVWALAPTRRTRR